MTNFAFKIFKCFLALFYCILHNLLNTCDFIIKAAQVVARLILTFLDAVRHQLLVLIINTDLFSKFLHLFIYTCKLQHILVKQIQIYSK